MGKVLVIGSFNMDMVVRTNQFPKPGETVLGGDFFTAFGGKGANQAVAAARLGGEVTFVGRLGSDSFADAALEHFKKEGVDTRFVIKDKNLPTGVALIILNELGENVIVVASGANGALAWENEGTLAETLSTHDVVLTQLETPLKTVEEVLTMAHRNGKTTILNPAPAQKLPEHLYKKISILTPNETEAESLTGVKVKDLDSAKKAAKTLRDRGVKTVIITLGDQGAFVSDEEFQGIIPAPQVKVLDSTAAGDVFNGTLATAISESQNLKSAVQFACSAAALSVTRLGAQPSIPFRREVL